MSAWAVDREFVNIYIGPNGVPMSPDWVQIRSNWAPIGLHLDPFGSHWPLWSPIACQARFGHLASSEVRSGRTRSAFWEHTAEWRKVVARPAARTPIPHAPGARMTVVTLTPSNYTSE